MPMLYFMLILYIDIKLSKTNAPLCAQTDPGYQQNQCKAWAAIYGRHNFVFYAALSNKINPNNTELPNDMSVKPNMESFLMGGCDSNVLCRYCFSHL